MGAVKLMVQMGGQVARITLNRPEKQNAFDREMMREMGDLVRGVGDSEKIRILLVDAVGEAFCAGADFAAVVASDSLSNYMSALSKSFHSVIDYLASSPALVVTYVNGPATGGGFSLALAGDLRLASPAAKFRAGHGRNGLSMDGGLSWRLPRLAGLGQAQRLIFEDAEIEAEEARALGLVHRVVAPADLPKTLEDLISRLKPQSRSSIARSRELLLGSQARTLAQALEAETVVVKTSTGMSDGQEGLRAFAEKRPPKWAL